MPIECSRRLGYESQSFRDTTPSNAPTWKYSSTSTVKMCCVSQCTGRLIRSAALCEKLGQTFVRRSLAVRVPPAGCGAMTFDVVTSCPNVRLHDISESSSSNRTPRIVALIPQKSFGRALSFAGFLFIAVLTLAPQYGTVKTPPSFCVLCGDTSVLDSILNVLLFIPLGLGLRLAGLSRRRAFAIGLVTTITVELLQLGIPGRDTSLGDIFTNSFGGFAGIICADIWRVIILPSRREAARIASVWVVIWLAVLSASAELAHISLPPTTAWGVWAPELLHHDYFPGTVHGATAGGLPTPNAISAASDDVRRRLSSDSVVVRASVTGGAPTTAIAAIATVYDWKRSQIF